MKSVLVVASRYRGNVGFVRRFFEGDTQVRNIWCNYSSIEDLDWVIMLRDLNLTAGTGTKTADNIPKSSNVNAPFDQPLTFAMTA